jgi:hypothetical protein
MTKSIQESLDLPVLEDLLKPSNNQGAEDEPEITDEMAEQFSDDQKLDQMANALASGAITTEVLDARREMDHDTSTESIYKEAMQHSKDLMDLGYNVDTRSAARIFENAAGMLKIALDAKNAKREAHFKQAKLLLGRRKLDLEELKIRGLQDGDDSIDSESVIIEDRNELIKRMREQANKSNK